MYKKAIALLLSAGFIAALGACSGENQEDTGGQANGEQKTEGIAIQNPGAEGEGSMEGTAAGGGTGNASETGGLRLLTSENAKGCYTEQGYYYLTFDSVKLADGNYASHLMYMDFASMQEIYLCSNTGCNHDTQDCPSVILWDDIPTASSLPFVWQDGLYILSKYPDNDGSMSFSAFIGGDESSIAGSEGSCAVLYRANLDGTDRKAVYSFESSAVLEDLVMGDEEQLYLVIKEISAEKDGQNTYYNSSERRLVSLEPSSGKLTDICSLDFNDSISWHIQGCYGRTLVLEGTDYGRQITNEEMFGDDDVYGELYENSRQVFATLALDNPQPVIRYRQDNKNINSSIIDGNMLYVSGNGDGAVRCVDLSTGVEQVICSRNGGSYYLYQKIGDKLCCEENIGDYAFSYIDVNTGEVQRSPLVNKSLGWSLDFRAVLNSDVLVIYDYDAVPSGGGSYEINRYQYGLISYDDLFAGRDNFRKINMIGKGE